MKANEMNLCVLGRAISPAELGLNIKNIFFYNRNDNIIIFSGWGGSPLVGVVPTDAECVNVFSILKWAESDMPALSPRALHRLLDEVEEAVKGEEPTSSHFEEGVDLAIEIINYVWKWRGEPVSPPLQTPRHYSAGELRRLAREAAHLMARASERWPGLGPRALLGPGWRAAALLALAAWRAAHPAPQASEAGPEIFET